MKTAKHDYPSLNIVAKATLGILFAFALSIIASSRAFGQEATSTANTLGSQDASISLSEIERINVFVKFLASNNVQERILAIKVLEALALRKQFPPEFVPVLVHLYDTDKDSIKCASPNGAQCFFAMQRSPNNRNAAPSGLFGSSLNMFRWALPRAIASRAVGAGVTFNCANTVCTIRF